MSTSTLSPTARRPRARRGTGHLYQRGAVWWVQYVVNGRKRRESTETTRKSEAAEFLQKRLGRAAEGRPLPPRIDKIHVCRARGRPAPPLPDDRRPRPQGRREAAPAARRVLRGLARRRSRRGGDHAVRRGPAGDDEPSRSPTGERDDQPRAVAPRHPAPARRRGPRRRCSTRRRSRCSRKRRRGPASSRPHQFAAVRRRLRPDAPAGRGSRLYLRLARAGRGAHAGAPADRPRRGHDPARARDDEERRRARGVPHAGVDGRRRRATRPRAHPGADARPHRSRGCSRTPRMGRSTPRPGSAATWPAIA